MGRPLGSKNKTHKQFCPKGHDTFIVGRTKKGMCNQCDLDRKHTDKVRQKSRERHNENKEEINSQRRKKRQENLEFVRKYEKEYRDNHREELILRNREWAQEHREERKAYRKEHYDPEAAHEDYLRNKEIIYAWNATIEGKFSGLRGVARRKKLPCDLTIELYKIIIEQGCIYCGAALIGTRGISLDKINFDGGYTIDNVLPCCRPCNFVRNRLHTVEETKIMIHARDIVRKYPNLISVFLRKNLGFIKSPFIDEDSWNPKRSKKIFKPITLKTRYGIFVSRHKIDGTKTSLSFVEYKDVVSNPCYYCNGSILSRVGHGLDRIDPNKEYDLNNVLPCCFVCNTIKNYAHTVDETKIMVIARNLFRKKFLQENAHGQY